MKKFRGNIFQTLYHGIEPGSSGANPIRILGVLKFFSKLFCSMTVGLGAIAP